MCVRSLVTECLITSPRKYEYFRCVFQFLRKPAPDGVWHILEVLGAEVSECLYVGDSEVDIETGKNAGLKTISVTWGFRSEQELREADPEHMIAKPADLLAYV
mgnify:CR=1 FL=1